MVFAVVMVVVFQCRLQVRQRGGERRASASCVGRALIVACASALHVFCSALAFASASPVCSGWPPVRHLARPIPSNPVLDPSGRADTYSTGWRVQCLWLCFCCFRSTSSSRRHYGAGIFNRPGARGRRGCDSPPLAGSPNDMMAKFSKPTDNSP